MAPKPTAMLTTWSTTTPSYNARGHLTASGSVVDDGALAELEAEVLFELEDLGGEGFRA